VQNHCGNLQGDRDHPTDMVRGVCAGTFDTARIPAAEKKYFPAGIPTQIDGITQLCAQVTCPVPPPAPAPATTPELLAAEVQVPAVPALVAAFQVSLVLFRALRSLAREDENIDLF
jgi:hypothetical protein